MNPIFKPCSQPARPDQAQSGSFARLVATVAVTLALSVIVIPAQDAGQQQREIDDEKIARAIQQQLRYESSTLAEGVTPTVNDGIAILQGTVGNLSRKRQAAEVAESVKGVRDVVNRLEVTPARGVDPERLQERIENLLTTDATLAGSSIESEVTSEGEVILRGEADSPAEKNYAVRLVRSLAGVVTVTDEIADASEAGGRVDSEIASDIKAQLRWYTGVDDALLEVSVSNGVANLSGVVGSAVERRRAAEIARRIAGVKSVDASEVEVQMWSRDPSLRGEKYRETGDARVEAALNAALPRLVNEDVRASVSDGVVTLEGEVDSMNDKLVAERVVRETVGVLEVRNSIIVNFKRGLSDAQLAEILTNAFQWDSAFEGSAINVRVADGTAYLSGTVTSPGLIRYAEEVASRPQGVTSIVNRLEAAVVEVPAEAADEAALAERIQDQFFWSPFVDSDEITIGVEGGAVTLIGEVDTNQERQLAAQLARRAGAASVDNQLVVP